MSLRVLLAIPHVFAPREGSLYSSQTEAKRATKQLALEQVTLGNLGRHGLRHWIHASLGMGRPVVTRPLHCSLGVELTIELYTPAGQSLANGLAVHPCLLYTSPSPRD